MKKIQDILPLVEKPSRYLGTEINRIKKDQDKVKLRVALAFPDLYEIGMSHLGLQIIYHILNKDQQISAERVFAPGSDLAGYLRSSDISLMTLESKRPLNRFDIIGFSLLYELNYTNILSILELGKIPFYAKQRDSDAPLVIAGGPCSCNPEPVAELFDAMVVGDGEGVVMEMAHSWIRWKETGNGEKESLLTAWSDIKGVYIPAFYRPTHNSAGFQILLPRSSEQQMNESGVVRAILADLDSAPFPDAPMVPFGKPVHDRLRLEIARGCSRGCRFCQAGMIYRPVRERSPKTLLSLSDRCLSSTGYEDVSLLSLSTGDYGSIVPLMERLMDRCEPQHVAVSLPSLRADTLTPELMKLIKRVRKTGFTIAPEAGSQRLREIINKNITEEEIIHTVKEAFGLGWQGIKLYFMIGLPYETADDLTAIVKLVKKIRSIACTGGNRGTINVSIATFIPKPHTPFQWASQQARLEAKEKISWLRRHLKHHGVQIKWQNPDVSFLEGLWARGDRRLTPLLVNAYQKGCCFDGWSDQFHYDRWKTAISDTEIDADFFTTRERDVSEPLPWDHIHTKISKNFLKREWQRTRDGIATRDCRWNDCHHCGVCDFVNIKPKTFEKCAVEKPKTPAIPLDLKQKQYQRFKISYSKLDHAKYFGHLELVNILIRALRRANIPVEYSKGFHPLPKVSFEDPLPIGMESQNEIFYLALPGNMKPINIINGLNRHLTEGIFIHDCRPVSSMPDTEKKGPVRYHIVLKDAVFNKDELDRFHQSAEWVVNRMNRKGKLKKINVKAIIKTIQLLAPEKLEITIRSTNQSVMRPIEVIRGIFTLKEPTLRQAKVIKIMSRNNRWIEN